MKREIEFLGNVTFTVADWEEGEDYSARTITTDYSTWTTYISRKNVPAGTPLTDLTYWKPILRTNQEFVENLNVFIEVILEHLETERTLLENITSQNEAYASENEKYSNENDKLAAANERLSTLATRLEYLVEHFSLCDCHGQTPTPPPGPGPEPEPETGVITKLYAGAGDDNFDIINEANSKLHINDTKETIQIVCEDNQHIYIAVNSEAATAIEDVTMNGFPVEMIDVSSAYDGYKVLKSVNPFTAGTYNIQVSYNIDREVVEGKVWMGAANEILEVCNSNNLRTDYKVAKNITVTANNEKLIAVFKSVTNDTLKMFMFGLEVPSTKHNITIDDIQYTALVSVNNYSGNITFKLEEYG